MNHLRPARTLYPSLLFVALLLAFLLFTVFFLTATASAQVPSKLTHSIPPPFGSPASRIGLGGAVAIDGEIAVAGMATSPSGRDKEFGIVTIFNAHTGAVLHRLLNTDQKYWYFGRSVAISGMRVAVWAANVTNTLKATIFIYDLSGPTPTLPIVTLDVPNRSRSGVDPIAMSGTYVLVGIPLDGGNTIPFPVPDIGTVYVFNTASATPNVPMATLRHPTLTNGAAFGQALAISGTRAVVGAPWDAYTSFHVGSAFVYDLTAPNPTTPIATLRDPDPIRNEQFGDSVAISGTQVVVGMPTRTVADVRTGGAYAYDLTSATPTIPTVSLNNPASPATSSLGDSVAISGTLVVVSDIKSGAYVYDLAGATPNIAISSLTDPVTGSHQFGLSVGLAGTRAVVGSPFDDTVALDAGAAYVYELANANSIPPATELRDFGIPSPSDRFGGPIAVSGTHVAVTGNLNKAVTIYDIASPNPATPTVTLLNPLGFGDFGRGLAISGNLVVAGLSVTQDPSGAYSSGKVFVYNLASATPAIPMLTLERPGSPAVDNFGSSVAIWDTKLVVGAPGESTDGAQAGSVYVFDLGGTTPTIPVVIIHNPEPPLYNHFGNAVAISGTRVVVGAYEDNHLIGSVYVYDLAGEAVTAPIAVLRNPAPRTQDNFGISVAISGPRVLVGGLDGLSSGHPGTAYLYDLTSATPADPVFTINSPHSAGVYFASQVAMSGPRAVIGAYIGGSGGEAFIYDFDGPNPMSPVAILKNPHPNFSNAYFGSAVAIDGTTVAVGASGDSTVALQKGYAYVFGPNPNDEDNNGLLDSWEMAHFGNATGHTATGDEEQDGINNLLEEAFDTDPLQSSVSALPAITNEGGFLTMTIAKRAGVLYEIQNAATPDPTTFSATTTKVLIDTPTLLKVRDNFPIGTPPTRFLRVKVTAAP